MKNQKTHFKLNVPVNKTKTGKDLRKIRRALGSAADRKKAVIITDDIAVISGAPGVELMEAEAQLKQAANQLKRNIGILDICCGRAEKLYFDGYTGDKHPLNYLFRDFIQF